MAHEQAQAISDMNRQAEAWKEQVTRDVHHQQTMVSDGQTSGLRQQLAEAQAVARKLEATENSMSKNQGETERLLANEKARTAELQEKVQKTEAESQQSSGSWTKVGSQEPPVQTCQGPPRVEEPRAPETEE